MESDRTWVGLSELRDTYYARKVSTLIAPLQPPRVQVVTQEAQSQNCDREEVAAQVPPSTEDLGYRLVVVLYEDIRRQE